MNSEWKVWSDIKSFSWFLPPWAGIFVKVKIYRGLWIGRDGHLEQSEAYDISPWSLDLLIRVQS